MKELKPYPEYKDSGVEWIGEIPSSWEKIKMKYVSRIYGRIGYRGYTVNDIVDKGQGAITLSPSNIKDGGLIYENVSYISWKKYYESPEIMLENNDIIFCKTGSSYGKVGMINEIVEPSTINPQLVVIKSSKIKPDFLFYLLKSSVVQTQIETIVVGGTIPTISQEGLRNMTFSIPSYKEQKVITNFLNKKSLEIDSLIADKERLIELLEEKRQAVITETVTKGLDPNVKMKDSGIEWIGEIPEHWGASKIKYFSEMKTGATPSRNTMEYWEEGTINWMTSGEVNQEYIYNIKNKITKLGLKNSSTIILPINTVMIALNGQGKTKGKVAILKVHSTCNQSLVGFISDEINLHYSYLYYFLKTKYRDLRGLVGDGLRDGISLGLLKTLSISLPSYNEQVKISSDIYYKEKEIIELTKKITQQISKLKEYRESLIYEAVTGKIDVRDYAAETEEVN